MQASQRIVLTALVASVFAISPGIAGAQNDAAANVDKTADVAAGNVSFGESFWYTINYQCSTITEPYCDGAQIVDALPDELTFLKAVGNPNATPDTSAVDIDNTVKFDFDYPSTGAPGRVPDGTTAQVRIQVRLQDTLDPAITQIVNPVSFNITNGTGDSDTDELTVNPPPHPVWSVSKSIGGSNGELTQETSYTIEYCLNSGYGNLASIQIEDTLPAGLLVADITDLGGAKVLVGDPGPVKLQWTRSELNFSEPLPVCDSVSYDVVYIDDDKDDQWDRDPQPLPAPVTNSGNVTGTDDDASPIDLPFILTHDLTPFVQDLDTDGRKGTANEEGDGSGNSFLFDSGTFYEYEPPPGADAFITDDTFGYTIPVNNSGNVEISELRITDVIAAPQIPPLTALSVDDSNDEITFTAPHGLAEGQALELVALGTAIGGLTDGGLYYVTIVDGNTVKLFDFRGDPDPVDLTSTAGGSRFALMPTPRIVQSVDAVQDTITFARPHGLLDDNPVEYVDLGGAIGGLSNGTVYHAIYVDDSTIQLSATKGGLAIDLTAGAKGDLFVGIRELDVTSFTTGAYASISSPDVTLDILYSTDPTIAQDAPDTDFTLVPGGPFDPTTSTEITVASLGLTAGQYITALRWRFNVHTGTIPLDFEEVTSPQVFATWIDPLRDGTTPFSAEIQVRNCVWHDRTSAYDGTTGNGESLCSDQYVRGPRTHVYVGKTTQTGDVQFPDDTITFELTLGSDADYDIDPALDLPLVNPVFYDLLPAELDYVASSWAVTENVQGITVPNPVVVTTDYQSTGRTLLKWDFADTFPAGEVIKGTIQTTPRSGDFPIGEPENDLSNELFGTPANNDGIFYCKEATDLSDETATGDDDNDLDGDSSTADQVCLASSSVVVRAPRLTVDTAKANVTGNIFHGQSADMTVSFQPTGTVGKDLDLVNPVFADLLPLGIEYVTGSWYVQSKPAGAPVPSFEAIANYNGTGRTLLRWSYSSSVNSGTNHTFALPSDAVVVGYQVKAPLGTPPATYVNDLYVLPENNDPTDDIFFCNADGTTSGSSTRVPDALNLDSDSFTTDFACGASANINVPATAQLTSSKLVRGQLDDEFSNFPDFGLTVPGGTLEYRIKVTNEGNVTMTDFVVVDILPYVGDTQVNDPDTPRLSVWGPVLTGPVLAPQGATVYYSISSNPCRGEINPDSPGTDPWPTGCVANSWTLAFPGDPTQVRALRFEFASAPVDSLDSLFIDFPMIAPIDAPDGAIAWNSFGYVATRDDDQTDLLPSEPRKVGVAIDRSENAYGNFVWLDTDKDGIQDPGETGINGIRVEIWQDDGDNVPEPGGDDTFLRATITSSDSFGNAGQYEFSGLPAGKYFAVIDPSPLYDVSPANQGSDDALDSDFLPTSPYNATAVATLSGGVTDHRWDAGLYPTENAAIGDYVWFDLGQDGQQDESPINGVNGVTVTLYDADDNLIATTVTTDDINGLPGYYVFEDHAPGDYYAVFGLPAAASAFTARNVGDDATDSDADLVTGKSDTVTLTSGEFNRTVDAGLIRETGPLSLGNVVFRDLDNDGIYEPADGEFGIDGVRLNLYKDTGNGTPELAEFFGAQITYTIAGESGYYLFDDLPAGDYIVEIDPSNFEDGGPLAGYQTSTGTAANATGPYEPAPDPDNDVDNDDNGTDGGAAGVVSGPITLGSGSEPDGGGDANLTLDFGFVAPAIGDYVWIDSATDGLQGGVELGFNGVNVLLYADTGTLGFDAGDPVVRKMVTADDPLGNPGYYLFDGLDPGDYIVRFQRPINYDFTTQNVGADDTIDSDANPDTIGGVDEGVTATTTLDFDTDDPKWDAGLVPRTTASIGNFVWFDENEDGDQDEGGAGGLNGITVNLYQDDGDGIPEPGTGPGQDGDPIKITVTAEDLAGNSGFYAFEELDPANDYFVEFVLEGRSIFTLRDNTGDDTTDSDANPDLDGNPQTAVSPVIDMEEGEYNDSVDAGVIVAYDFGDLPEAGTSLATTLGRDGARHLLSDATTYLGASVDAELNGQPDATATGDDSAGTLADDEDGVAFVTPLVQGTTASIEVTAASAGVLNAWIDFNGDGDFNDTDEHRLIDVALSAGAQTVSVVVPSGLGIIGPILANIRFRFTANTGEGGDSPTGLADNGEVEDYQQYVLPDGTLTFDYGDLPEAPRLSTAVDTESDQITVPSHALSTNDLIVYEAAATPVGGLVDGRTYYVIAVDANTIQLADTIDGAAIDLTTAETGDTFGYTPYPVTLAKDGARHAIVSGVYLGTGVDAEADGQPSANARGDDDLDGNDDEDGVDFLEGLTPGQDSDIEVTAGTNGLLYAWADWNNDGDFDDAGEQVFAAQGLSTGTNPLSITVPGTAVSESDPINMRFRFVTDGAVGGDTPEGYASDGEVEDYQVLLDYGDLPATLNNTLAEDDGARHLLDGITYLGSAVDDEYDGQESTDASGDDTAGDTPDDEDGIIFMTPLTEGTNATVRVTASAPGFLNAWVDFNGNGVLDETDGERIFTDKLIAAGTSDYDFPVPSAISGLDSPQLTNLRFRYTAGTGDGGGSPTGMADTGEVEDYQQYLIPDTGTNGFDFGDHVETYGTTIGTRGDGARHAIVPTVYLGTEIDAETDGLASGDALGDDNDGTPNDEDGIVFVDDLRKGGTSDITVTASVAGGLNAWADWNGDGDFDDAGEQIFDDASLISGSNPLAITVPLDADVTGNVNLRFRYTTVDAVGGDTPEGYASDGEVEDYRTPIFAASGSAYDYGDLPDGDGGAGPGNYPTTNTDGGEGPAARHVDDGVTYLGAAIDTETDGQLDPGGNATGDDTAGSPDDEDGIYFATPLTEGLNGMTPADKAEIRVLASRTASGEEGVLNGWADWNGDGVFGPGEQIVVNGVTDGANADGTTSFFFDVPNTVDVDNVYLRFRYVSNVGSGGDDWKGQASDGEIEDYRVRVLPATSGTELDYGDLPETGTGINTVLLNDGPRHVIENGGTNGGLRMGAAIDTEADGQPSATAGGDGISGDDGDGSDDEDGVTLPSLRMTDGGATYSVTVDVTNTLAGAVLGAGQSATLVGWIDFDGDGSFDPATESATATVSNGTTSGTAQLDFTVPGDIAEGGTIVNARFRLSTDPGLSTATPDGFARDGEVEDYQLTIAEPELGVRADFGDAPDSYGTTITNSGARHDNIADTLKLGADVDADEDGTAPLDASGDDATDLRDDEDGLVSIDAIASGDAGESKTVTVTVTNSTGADANLVGWIDFDGDGSFDPATEASNVVTVPDGASGNQSLTFTVPDDVTPGATYLRLRLAPSASGLSASTPTGAVSGGEVEDHPISIDAESDYGDVPASYEVGSAASHSISGGATGVTGVYLGSLVDEEGGVQSSTGADGDDLAGTPDDEDGVAFTSLLIGDTAGGGQITVTAAKASVLNAWADFNGDGVFDDPSERIFTNEALAAGANDLSFDVPASAAGVENLYLRFRVTETTGQGGDSPTGAADNGEVEDYVQRLYADGTEFDFGDLPESGTGYTTTLVNYGAFHIASGVTLGSVRDPELNGQPTAGADGDDSNGSDDEDGIVFTSPLVANASTTLTVLSSGAGYLSGWVDFNDNGSFDVGEQVFDDQLLEGDGSTDLSFAVPAGAVDNDDTYIRFRVTDAPNTGGDSPEGVAESGEVEDYVQRLYPAGTTLDYGDLPETGTGFETTLYRNGASHVIDGRTYLGASVDAESDGQPSATAGNDGTTGDDGDGSDDEDGVFFPTPLTDGEQATIRINPSTAGAVSVWIDINGDGDFLDGGEQLFSDHAVATSGPQDLPAFTVVAGGITTPVLTNIRVRYTASAGQGGASPSGPADSGEVEDYQQYLLPAGAEGDFDYGDHPDSYGTLIASDGARHAIDAAIYLGAGVDGETDGQPSADALQDDTTGTADDEDGVSFLDDLRPGGTTDIGVTASVAGKLYAWADWNDDGVFDPVTEQIFAGETLSAGANALAILPPYGMVATGDTALRFRFVSDDADVVGGDTPTGYASEGEIEDYLIANFARAGDDYDYGDLPDTDDGSDGSVTPQSYPTTETDGGEGAAAKHLDDGTTFLGSAIDTESDGLPSVGADGDDLDASDDEDGIYFASPLTEGMNGAIADQAEIRVVASQADGVLYGWADWNGDGDFDDTGELIVNGETTDGTDRDGGAATGDGTTRLYFDVPNAVDVDDVALRFRYTSADGSGGDDWAGPASDGEVEDYVLPVLPLDSGVELDYGDLPETGTGINTVLLNDGPRHVIENGGTNGGLRMGAAIDTEADGQPSATAGGDGISGDDGDGSDDEDGVTLPSLRMTDGGATYSVTVDVTNTLAGAVLGAGQSATLVGWIDFDGDGSFDPATESATATVSNGTTSGTAQLDFTVPGDIAEGGTIVNARFRLSTDPGLSTATPDGFARDGEVEDYQLTIAEPELGVRADFGDAPDSYGTTITNSGARHDNIADTLKLGADVDADEDGTAPLDASGDDATDLRDDEDGLVSIDAIASGDAGESKTVTVTVTNSTGADANLVGWIDFDGDGSFDPATEASNVVTVPDGASGNQSLTFTVPDDVTPGATYLRLRLAPSASGLSASTPTGAVSGGEVEDHPISIDAESDYGDVPASYEVGSAASHSISGGATGVTGVYLGSLVDEEGGVQSSTGADGDDLAGTPDDEDGVAFTSLLIGDTAGGGQITVTAAKASVLNAWADFNGDGVFDDPSERIFTNEALAAGANDLSFDVPASAAGVENLYLRFRVTETTGQGGDSPTGAADNGEVEDYVQRLYADGTEFDFGDLPESGTGYTTTLVNYGAFHIASGVTLGSVRDPELNGQPTAGADGDDSNGSDDEDGVVFVNTLVPGTATMVDVTAPNGGVLNAWIDFNGNGTLDAGEQIFDDLVLAPGLNNLSFPLPLDAASTVATGARFRVTDAPDQGGGTPSGVAESGEVEDYLVAIEALPANGVDFGDLADGPYRTLLANNGAHHIIDSSTVLGAILDAELDGQPDAAALGDDDNGSDEDGVVFTRDLVPAKVATVDVTTTNGGVLNAWIDFDGNGTLDVDEQIFSDLSVAPGLNSLSYRVPEDATSGITGVRFRLTAAAGEGGQRPAGRADTGEVEDYLVQIQAPIVPLGSIGNRVWIDEDGDGFQDAGEAGIGDVVIELLDDNGVVIDSTLTDTEGGYLFPNLPAGSYEVRVDAGTLPVDDMGDPVVQTSLAHPNADYGNQTQSDGTSNDAYPVTIAAGEENLTADFGYNWRPSAETDGNTGFAALGDRVWIDADGDGVQDKGEPGVKDVSVTLTGAGFDGIFGNGDDPVPVTLLTDAAGNYLFNRLPPGAYRVTVDAVSFEPAGSLAGYLQTGDPDRFALPPDGSEDHANSAPVLLAPGDTFLNADFGYQPPAAQDNSVGDTVWFDADGDALFQPDGADGIPDTADDEYGIGGVTVKLLDAGDEVVAAAVTDENGNYLFSGLPDGIYRVVVDDTDNVLDGMGNTNDPDNTAPDNESVVDLDSAGTDLNPVQELEQDFGYAPPGHQPGDGLIGDTVFLDRNGNGLPDPGEGIEGAIVELRDSIGSRLLEVAATDENGRYSFGRLFLDTYQVVVDTRTLPPGLSNTVDPDGGFDGVSTVTVDATTPIDLRQDFGYEADAPAAIGGTVWEDRNADGILSPRETDNGFEGVRIVLYEDLNRNGMLDNYEPVVARTESDADGDYSFSGLPPGDYLVVVTDETNVLEGFWKSDGQNDGADNNSQDTPYAIGLAAGEIDETADFGYYADGAALGNRIWEDDNNGIQDIGETGIGNVNVTLTITYPSGDVVEVVVVTGGDGFYSFPNLLLDEDFNGAGTPGAGGDTPAYLITVETPVDFVPSPVEQGIYSESDSNDHAGTDAAALQGRMEVELTNDPFDDAPNATYDYGFTPDDGPVSCAVTCDVNMNNAVDVMDIYFIFRNRGMQVSPGGNNSGDCIANGVLGINDAQACQAFLP